jgi:hypothetical protein
MYAKALVKLEDENARSAPLLRRSYDRVRDPDLEPLVYVYDRPQ